MPATDFNWPPATNAPPLSAGDLHVWSTPLTADPETVQRLSLLLSEDELQRAQRYLLPHLGPRFIVGRARQREILAAYLDTDPKSVQFHYSPLGKPSVGAPHDDSGLQFNVTNSADLALVAVTLGREIGVDVERIRPVDDFEGLAQRYFAAAEQATLSKLPAGDRLDGFFRCWTRKEAILKATGKGLSCPLDRVVVSLAADQPARVLSIDGDEQQAGNWFLKSMQPSDAFIAAVATTGAAPRIRTMQFSNPSTRAA